MVFPGWFEDTWTVAPIGFRINGNDGN